ncbi:4367_t:CDS:2, partial [Funneliformis geosporum]
SHKSVKQTDKTDIGKPIINSGKTKQSKQSTLENTICKIIQSELKLIFSALITQDSKTDTLKQALPIQEQSDEIPITKDILPYLEEVEYLDDPMEINFVQKKEPKTSVATIEKYC